MANAKSSDERIEGALPYYVLALSDILGRASFTSYQRSSEVFSEMLRMLETERTSSNGRVHVQFIGAALAVFARNGWVDFIVDPYADDFLRRNEKTFLIIENDRACAALQYKREALGDAAYDWMLSALSAIPARFSAEEVRAYRDLVREPLTNHPLALSSPSLEPDDEWQPLKIDRSTSAYQEAVESTEAAAREIEGSNGYAKTEPEERNGIVSTINGTLRAIKEGAPSRASIHSGLLSPLRYIVKKFTDNTMGELAKLAIAKPVFWLLS